MRYLLTLLALVLLTACTELTELLEPPGLEQLVIHPNEITLTVGEKFRFYATASYTSGVAHRPGVTWESSNTSLGLVDANGVVTGLAESGEFRITATLGDVQSVATVRLLPRLEECLDSGGVLDARIANVQLLQTTEVGVNGVPAITGRPLWVRISLLADHPVLLTAPAEVKVHVLRNDVPIGSVEAIGPDCLGTTPELSQPTRGFVAEVPASWLHSNIKLYVTAGSSLRYPEEGYMAVAVRQPPELDLVLVPVDLPHVGLERALSGAEAQSIIDRHRSIFPLDTINFSIREPYQYQNSDDLAQLIRELTELWLMDESSSFYQGVVPVGEYDSMAAGVGQLSGPISWGKYELFEDFPLLTGWTLSHELGHNFGLAHAPCGDAPGSRPFPYSGGLTGTYGVIQFSDYLDMATPEHSDLMGYCGNRWISDHHYLTVLNTLEELITSIRERAATHSLLVSGTINAENVILRPAFALEAAAKPPRAGSWRWQLLDPSGTVLTEASFEPYELSGHDADPTAMFAFTVPVVSEQLARASSARILGPGGQVAAVTGQAAVSTLNLRDTVSAITEGDRTFVNWDPELYPAVIVMNSEGTVLSRGDSGRIVLNGKFETLELLVSTGLSSRTLTLEFD